MSNLLLRLNDALYRNAAVRQGSTFDDPEQPRTTANEAYDLLFGWVYKQPGMATMGDCQRAATKIKDRFGDFEVRALFMRYACDSIKSLWIGSYADFVEWVDACLHYNVPPSASWMHNPYRPHPAWLNVDKDKLPSAISAWIRGPAEPDEDEL